MRFLIDEMFPASTVDELQRLGHEAKAVVASELAGASDARVFETALAEQQVVVTENARDFAPMQADRLRSGLDAVPVVFVLKRRLPRGSARMGAALAQRLDSWAAANPDPHRGQHWA